MVKKPYVIYKFLCQLFNLKYLVKPSFGYTNIKKAKQNT